MTDSYPLLNRLRRRRHVERRTLPDSYPTVLFDLEFSDQVVAESKGFAEIASVVKLHGAWLTRKKLSVRRFKRVVQRAMRKVKE